MGEPTESVYNLHADTMRGLLADPYVNIQEHTIYWPRLKALLPRQATRVLDFGCGPGNFTYDMADMYSDAHIIGVDKQKDLLPVDSQKVTFKEWDGVTPLQVNGNFDLVVSKMALHYLSDANLRSLAANLLRLLTPGGRIAFSVPHPADSSQFNTRKRHEWSRLNATGSIKREVGSTGLSAAMYHRNIAEWIKWIWDPLKEAYPELQYTVVIDDDIYNETGEPKRLDLMFLSASDPEHSAAYRRIQEMRGSQKESVIKVNPATPEGRRLLYGELLKPPKPLP